MKGIVQPFELGGETRLIQSAVNIESLASFNNFLMIQSHERSTKPFSLA
jgi:hypothetical protein